MRKQNEFTYIKKFKDINKLNTVDDIDFINEFISVVYPKTVPIPSYDYQKNTIEFYEYEPDVERQIRSKIKLTMEHLLRIFRSKTKYRSLKSKSEKLYPIWIKCTQESYKLIRELYYLISIGLLEEVTCVYGDSVITYKVDNDYTFMSTSSMRKILYFFILNGFYYMECENGVVIRNGNNELN